MNAGASWRPVARDVRYVGDRVIKRATVGSEKLLREIDWLRAIPNRWRHRFPAVLSSASGDGWAEYQMPLYPWPDLADQICGGQISEERLLERTAAIVDFAFEALYTCFRSPTPPRFFERNYLDKFENRVRSAQGISETFDSLQAHDRLVVDGRECLSPAIAVETIRSSTALLDKLTPAFVAPFHGDFKYDNFLVDPESGEFILIDPRGATPAGDTLSDYVEDVAKLRTCTLACYDLIRAGRVAAEVDGPQIDLSFGAGTAAARKLLGSADQALIALVRDRAEAMGDPHWQLRLEFLTPLLLLANAPFQLVDDGRRSRTIAIALYAIGARMLDSALARTAADAAPEFARSS